MVPDPGTSLAPESPSTFSMARLSKKSQSHTAMELGSIPAQATRPRCGSLKGDSDTVTG
jgi:hypothetical protein